jgi:hypothetical protein
MKTSQYDWACIYHGFSVENFELVHNTSWNIILQHDHTSVIQYDTHFKACGHARLQTIKLVLERE